MFLLSAKNITKNYAAHRALNNVSIDIPKQSIFGLLGPNGAGKTSLIRIITQITAADSGQVYFNGEPLSPKHISQIGYMPEERGLYKKMKVGEQLLYLAQLKGMPKAEAIAKIKEWLSRLDIKDWWNKNVEELSKGMQQKVQFIATVLHQPPLIILDEPFTGFDPVNANVIKNEILQLKAEGSTIIFSTHRMESVEELCDSIALINKSEKLLDGPTRSIRHQYKSNYWHVESHGKPMLADAEYSVLRQTSHENTYHSDIRMPLNGSPNKLLAELIKSVEVIGFRQRIPSINDIFIAKVTGQEDLIFQDDEERKITEEKLSASE
ncbi:MAG: ABC transporter ATP-binding protein [Bacteroidota bacterium]